MKQYKKWYAMLFLLALFSFSVFNVIKEKNGIAEKVAGIERPESAKEMKNYLSRIDGALTDQLVGGHRWNELYGRVCNALGKNEENSFKYVRDKEGFLYSGNFYNTSDIGADVLAGRVRRMQDSLPEGSRLIVLMYPTKFHKAWSHGYYGIPYNDLNAYADEVLRYFRRYDIDYMDYRDIFLQEKMTMQDIFYRTDHHWNVPTAFFATGKFIEHLNEKYGAGLDADGFYRDISNYELETHQGIYMGSQGRDAGVAFSRQLDDFTYIIPKFDTNYRYKFRYRNKEKGEKEGDALHTLIDKKYLNYSDVYTREMNNTYLQGIVLTDQITNRLVREGEGPSMLFIRDSYSSPLACFLAPMCHEIDLLWSLHFKVGDVEKTLKAKKYDYVVIALAIDDFKDEAFPFFIEEKGKEP